MSDYPIVSVLVPARNEERDIGRCLGAVLSQDYPHDRMEIVLVDGGSDDGTVSAAREVLREGDVRWQIVRNVPGTTPSNLNRGLAVAGGDLICRVDARSLIPGHYVSCCAEVLRARPEVAVTGGAQVAISPDDSVRRRAIARALNNRFAMGGARYRSRASSGPADTVYLGAFRTTELRASGGWDEAMLTNQDFELNRRLGRGRVVWFDERISVGYVPRSSLRALWQQYHRFGRWKVRYWRHVDARPERRQQVLIAAPPCIGLGLLLVVRRRPLAAACAAASAVALVEHVGGPRAPYDLAERVLSQVAVVVVAGAWWTGVVIEWLRGR